MLTRDRAGDAPAARGGLLECRNCNARISRRVTECPWCGAVNPHESGEVIRKRVSLGALLLLVAVGAVLFALIAVSLK